MAEVTKANFGGSRKRESFEAFLELNAFINEFKAKQRAIEFRGSPGVERNGEHTFHVEFMCLMLNEDLNLGYDALNLILKAKFHDLVEFLEGDTPMFQDTFRGEPPPDAELKRAKEERAYAELNRRFGKRFPWMIKSVRSYLDLSDEESVFVSAMGKLIAVTNIFQDEGRSWRIRGIPIEVAYQYHLEGASRHPVAIELYEQVWELIREHAARHPNLYAPNLLPSSDDEERRRSE